jgi:simple sugar transport system permease protein
MFWSTGIAIILGLIFHRHRFGIHVKVAGDEIPKPDALWESNIERTKTLVFRLIGICSSLTGIFAVLLNHTFSPTMGDGYLLPTLAAVLSEAPL